MFFHFLGLKKPMAHFTYRIAQVWALVLIKITRCPVTVNGRENIPKKGGICFVSNHDGYFDIVLLLAYCGRPIGFVAKKELSFVPFLNAWIFMLGGLFIDRGKARKAMRKISRGVKKIQAGGGMIIFPEGHRSRGRGLLPFHPGSLKLATTAEAPIVPVALEGAYELFEKNYRYSRTSFKVTFCEPIDTKILPSGDRKQVLSDRIFSVIKEQLDNS
ncbi:MAG: 1-acyl-sn-glycerol-3-phosphate acyltransferase [Treponema sp.]|nr:1-acyl-sn-glycerol-3-phosphate acyltransferase [Treponema sp.]